MNPVYPVVVEGNNQPQFVQAQPAPGMASSVTATPQVYSYQPAQPFNAQPMQPTPVQTNPIPVTVVPPATTQGAPVSQYYPAVNNVPQNTMPEINDDLRHLFKLYPMLIVTVIIDWFAFGVVGLYLFMILGSVYLCNFNYALLIIYCIHRYIAIICSILLIVDEPTVFNIIILAVNCILTVYVTYYTTIATKVNKKYNSNQIQYLRRNQCHVCSQTTHKLTQIISVRMPSKSPSLHNCTGNAFQYSHSYSSNPIPP